MSVGKEIRIFEPIGQFELGLKQGESPTRVLFWQILWKSVAG